MYENVIDFTGSSFKIRMLERLDGFGKETNINICKKMKRFEKSWKK